MNTDFKANDRQVAGTHYRHSVQHWDYAAANGLDYFEGQITKYVTRWRKKHPTAAGRLDDIQKALHFAEKFAEVTADTQRTLGVVNTAVWVEAARIAGQPQYASYIRAIDFCAAQDMAPADASVIIALESFRIRGGDYLNQAIEELRKLVEEGERALTHDPRRAVDEAAVDALAAAMKDNLEVKRLQGRGGWETRPYHEHLVAAGRHAGLASRSVFSVQNTAIVDSANYLAFALHTAGQAQDGAPGAGYVNQDR